MNLAAHSGPLPSSPLAVQSTPPAPASPPCDGCPLLSENLELRQQAGYWKRACINGLPHASPEHAQAEIEQLRAQLRLRERQLFGRKAEPAPTHPPDQATGISSSEPPRPRGQQRSPVQSATP